MTLAANLHGSDGQRRAGADLLNVRYFLKPASAAELNPVYADANWKVYANPGACPRAWIEGSEGQPVLTLGYNLSPPHRRQSNRRQWRHAGVEGTVLSGLDGARERQPAAHRRSSWRPARHSDSQGGSLVTLDYAPHP